MCRSLDPEQRRTLHELRLPLPSARLKLATDDPTKVLIENVLRDDGLELAQMKLKHFREPFFSKGERPAFFLTRELTECVEKDDLHKRRCKAVLGFELPSGCYATMVVKRITRLPVEGLIESHDE
jgi:tRNA pseudouridine13 synthase